MRKPSARGISLVEAVVALAVMAFGMLAYVGLQSTLRFNSDVAKQRSEAVRIAQEAIEDWRAYAVVETDPDGTKAYDDVAAGVLEPVAIDGANAVYSLARTVVDAAATEDALLRGAAPRMKALQVDVSWQDRNGETQTVSLRTSVAASPPELAGTLAINGAAGPLKQPRGRSPAIPLAAKDLGSGISGFKPPDAGGTTVWVFDNTTGVIVGVCNAVVTGQADLNQADVQSCSNNANGLPLSGFIRFATGVEQPTAALAERPTSTALNLGVRLELTSPGHAVPNHVCFASAPVSLPTTRTVVPYYCAVFFLPNTVPRWSGLSTLVPLAFAEPTGSEPWVIAEDAGDVAATSYRVCRYTPATSDAQSVPNRLHPRNYVLVNAQEPLSNQNFLVIRAGDGITPFQCPSDVPADPAAGDFVNSNTLPHQPAP